MPCTGPAAAGLLTQVTANGVSARLSTGFAWYNSSTDAEQPSGAYIFRWGGGEGGGRGWECCSALPAGGVGANQL